MALETTFIINPSDNTSKLEYKDNGELVSYHEISNSTVYSPATTSPLTISHAESVDGHEKTKKWMALSYSALVIELNGTGEFHCEITCTTASVKLELSIGGAVLVDATWTASTDDILYGVRDEMNNISWAEFNLFFDSFSHFYAAIDGVR